MRSQQLTTPAFSQRSARLVGGLALASLLAAFALMLSPADSLRVESNETDSYSRSALGHLGLVNLLRERGYRVRTTRHRRRHLDDPLDTRRLQREPSLLVLATGPKPMLLATCPRPRPMLLPLPLLLATCPRPMLLPLLLATCPRPMLLPL